MTIFAKDMSKAYLSIKDFRTSELEIDSGAADGEITVDPADITSEVKWDYARSALGPVDAGRIISGIKAQDRLKEVVRCQVDLLLGMRVSVATNFLRSLSVLHSMRSHPRS
jgi:zearalenone synthase (highly reducing iterative type I polyketide synthase)